MHKRYLLFLPLLLLACKTLMPPQKTPTPSPAPPSATAEATATEQRATETPTATLTASPTSKPSGLTIVQVKKSGGDLMEQLAAMAEEARKLNQMPVVNFTASWCPACQAIKTSLDDENQLMRNAFEGIYLIEVDVDDWDWDHAENGFEFEYIPVFFKLGYDGKPSGEKIDGSAWEENIPENMAPPLDEFFHGEG